MSEGRGRVAVQLGVLTDQMVTVWPTHSVDQYLVQRNPFEVQYEDVEDYYEDIVWFDEEEYLWLDY
jgi:hypothetical protein